MATLGKRFKHGISSLALVSLLGACGGSDGGDVALPDVPTPTATVTEANAAQVATLALTLDTAALTPNLVGIAQAPSAAAAPSLQELVMGHADMLRNHMRGMSGRVVPLLTATNTLPCAIAGTLTLTINVADPSIISVGDSLSITYNQCEDVTGLLSGSVSITFTALSGTAGIAPYSGTMAMSYSNFRLSVGADYMQMNGGLRLSESDNGLVFSAGISGNSMTMSSFIAGQLNSVTLSNFALNASLDYATWVTTSSMDYSVDAAALGGTISVATTQAFKTSSGALYPYQGVLVVSGANNTKVRLTAIDAINVQLEGDFDGDGTYEYLLVTTWAAL